MVTVDQNYLFDEAKMVIKWESVAELLVSTSYHGSHRYGWTGGAVEMQHPRSKLGVEKKADGSCSFVKNPLENFKLNCV